MIGVTGLGAQCDLDSRFRGNDGGGGNGAICWIVTQSYRNVAFGYTLITHFVVHSGLMRPGIETNRAADRFRRASCFATVFVVGAAFLLLIGCTAVPTPTPEPTRAPAFITTFGTVATATSTPIASESTATATPVPTSSPDTGATDQGSSAHPEDRAALVVFYYATDGPNWTTSTNWLSGEPLDEWHGVTTDADGRVVELAMPDNALSGEIPAELGSLANLEALDLALNGLSGEIPSELGNLSRLHSLRLLGGNDFSGCMPAELRNVHDSDLTHLRSLGFCGVTTLSVTAEELIAAYTDDPHGAFERYEEYGEVWLVSGTFEAVEELPTRIRVILRSASPNYVMISYEKTPETARAIGELEAGDAFEAECVMRADMGLWEGRSDWRIFCVPAE